ncbi:MAG: hemerythrin domain-containing protein [Dehalococcoidia bacterium]
MPVEDGDTQATRDGTPLAIQVLLSEHDDGRQRLARALQTLQSVVAANRGAIDVALREAGELLQYLEGALETHILKEEGPLFPRLKAALPADDRLIDEMVAEHDLIRMKREAMRAALHEILAGHDDVRSERAAIRTALVQARDSGDLTEVQRAVEIVAGKMRVHFENEEELVFPLAADLLSADEIAQIDEEILTIG